MAGGTGGIRGRGQLPLAEPRQFRGIGKVHGRLVHGTQEPARIFAGEVGDLAVEGTQPCLAFGIKFGAGGTEGAQGLGDQPGILAREPGGVQGGQSCKKFLVQVDGILVRRDQGLKLGVDFAQLIGAVCREHRPVRHQGPAQERAAAFHGHEGVLEGRRRGVLCDGPEFLQLTVHAVPDRVQVVGGFQG